MSEKILKLDGHKRAMELDRLINNFVSGITDDEGKVESKGSINWQKHYLKDKIVELFEGI